MSSMRARTPQAHDDQESFYDAEFASVLSQYMNLLHEGTHLLHHYIAPNGMLDWFGTNIRGPDRVQSFVRYKICAEYEHTNFNKADKCDPIERIPSHERTKAISNETVDHRKSNKYNKVSGSSSLKLFADSDVEEDDVSMIAMHDEKQPTDTKDEVFHSNEESDSEMESKAKRLKRSYSPFYYLKHWGSKTRPQMEGDISSSDEEEDNTKGQDADKANPIYTTLNYFESVGILRPHGQNELRGANYSSNSGYPGERAVRIRISYRTRIPSQELQIALIIYENIERPLMKMRRRLTYDWAQEDQATEEELATVEVNHAEEDVAIVTTVDEQPALIRNADEEMIVATVESPSTEEIAAALESAAFTIVPFGTPTKQTKTPSTPKRQPRIRQTVPQLRRSNLMSDPSASTSKRGAARCLRL